MQVPTIPKAAGPPVSRGTYACIPRGLTGTDEWADLSMQARLVGLTLFTVLPATPVGSLPTAILSAYTGLTRAQCRAAMGELAEAGYVAQLADGRWAAPVLLDAVAGSARHRVLRDVRDLPDDAKAALAARHPWVILRVKDLPVDVVENSDASRAHAFAYVTEPNRTKSSQKLFGSGRTTKAPGKRHRAGSPGGATVPASGEVKGKANDNDSPATAGLPGPRSAEAKPPASTATPQTGDKRPSLLDMVREQGVRPPGELAPTIENDIEAAAFEADRRRAKAMLPSALKPVTAMRKGAA